MKHIIFFFLIYLTQFLNLSSNEPKLEELIKGLKNPWSMSFITDENILITEKSGNLLKINLTNKKIKKLTHNLNVYRFFLIKFRSSYYVVVYDMIINHQKEIVPFINKHYSFYNKSITAEIYDFIQEFKGDNDLLDRIVSIIDNYENKEELFKFSKFMTLNEIVKQLVLSYDKSFVRNYIYENKEITDTNRCTEPFRTLVIVNYIMYSSDEEKRSKWISLLNKYIALMKKKYNKETYFADILSM